ncbi:MAG: peptidase M50 [Parcubacteria group bacterium Gr01-1014_18]|nr:MAG: peptidase M50 [Parcubacteria group bacterium Greene0416_36]TSC80931.1 MAG: peptidase M50 [Parcubacteria group bacterium Gr01-1014_18]TSC98726.1 MAG: peptidase M50 [Parcubacteria group bacterium Greene1014_20]TSD06478.1 MAG: peptidase M50 [Parcubacteria group bacterium Greene0714_2]
MFLDQLFTHPAVAMAFAAAILLALTVHEFAHALVASWFGDDTAEREGRLTLNPLPHLDPFGTLMLLLVGFGWGKPVPIDPRNFKNPKRDSAWVAIAGPLSNLLFGLFAVMLYRILGAGGVAGDSLVYGFLFYLVNINAVLMLFNLIPLPPLDGSKILFACLPEKYREWEWQLERTGPMILLFLVIIDSFTPISIFGTLFGGILNTINRLL